MDTEAINALNKKRYTLRVELESCKSEIKNIEAELKPIQNNIDNTRQNKVLCNIVTTIL